MYNAEAVVVGSKNFGEADRIVQLFTREQGLVEAIAYGARRPKSGFSASLQMFSHVEVALSEGKRIDTVKSAVLKEHFKRVNEDIEVMAYGAFVAEFLREFLPRGENSAAAFDIVLSVLDSFERRNPRVTALIAVLQLLEFTGIELHYERCVHCGKKIEGDAFFSVDEGGALCQEHQEENAIPFPNELREFILTLRDFNWNAETLTVKGKLLVEAEKIILDYLENTLGHDLKSLKFIRTLN